jgi:tetratricopeptide (TPR) repeat protein
LVRENLRELLEGVRNPESGLSRTWNVVEAIELLVDAGQFKVARQLADYICGLLGDDERQRLFVAYKALCSIAIDGELQSNLSAIDTISHQITLLGHSHADRLRIALVRARALGIGVAMRALPESEILTARSLLEAQYRTALEAGKPQLALLAGLELIRTYVYAHNPELLAARGLLSQLVSLVNPEQQLGGQVGGDSGGNCQGVTDDMRCDLARFRYHIECSISEAGGNEFIERRLRADVAGLGEVSRALAELTIARLAPDNRNRATLEHAYAVFEHHGHIAAAAEAALALAGASLSIEHHARAQRFFTSSQALAEQGGSLYVLVSTLLGLFQTHVVTGDFVSAKALLRRLSTILSSDLALTAFGLPVVSALQVAGSFKAGERLARKCLTAARSSGVVSLEHEAYARLAGCLAGAGNWRSAASYYRTGALSAVRTRNFSVAAELFISTIQSELLLLATSKSGSEKADPKALAERQDNCSTLVRVLDDVLGKVCVPHEVLSLRARAEQLRAELLALSGDSVGCVKRLGEARRLYASGEQFRNVALVDACSGVALLEVAKKQGAGLWDEVFSSMQRALDYFEKENDITISWKIKYYLALSASLRSKGESEMPKQVMWAEVAHTWLEGAVRDHAVLAGVQTGSEQPVWSNEFAPMLLPEALVALKRSLRKVVSEEQDVPAKRTGRGRVRSARFKGQLH